MEAKEGGGSDVLAQMQWSGLHPQQGAQPTLGHWGHWQIAMADWRELCHTNLGW